jgi:hypothetical protein
VDELAYGFTFEITPVHEDLTSTKETGAYLTGWLRWLCRATYAPVEPLPKENKEGKTDAKGTEGKRAKKKERKNGIFNSNIM